MASMDFAVVPVAKQPNKGKSFAQALSGPGGEFQLTMPPPKIVIGKSVRIKITQDEYESGLADCRSNIHGRLILHKGDTPLTTQALKMKLSNLWPNIQNWISLHWVRVSLSFTLIVLKICAGYGLWGW